MLRHKIYYTLKRTTLAITKLFWFIRRNFKLLLKKLTLVDMFCKRCGRDCKVFIVDDSIWKEINGSLEGVLCYDCFYHKAKEEGMLNSWYLVMHEAAHPPEWWKGYPRGKYWDDE